MGRAFGVGHGGVCPMVDRPRSAGAFIYLEGEPAETVYYVKHGAVVLQRDADEPSRDGVAWTVRRAGALIGTEALVRATYVDSARAVTDVVLCAAPRELARAWVASRHPASGALLELVVRAQCSDVPRGAGADGNAVRRVARWLLDQPKQHGPQLPRGVVAELLGMEPETLSRALSSLASTRAIEVSRRRIDVVDAHELRAVADGGVVASRVRSAS
jgi:CRP-like cAMP-binding protein